MYRDGWAGFPESDRTRLSHMLAALQLYRNKHTLPDPAGWVLDPAAVQ